MELGMLIRLQHLRGDTCCPPPAICGAGMGQDASRLARRRALSKEGLLAEPVCGVSMYRTITRGPFPGQIRASRGAEQSCWDTTAAIGLPPCSQPLPQAAGGRGAGAALSSALASLLPCKRAAKGGAGSGQGIFAVFSYLLLGRWNGALERSSGARHRRWRGCTKGTCAPPCLQGTWQAAACKNKLYT